MGQDQTTCSLLKQYTLNTKTKTTQSERMEESCTSAKTKHRKLGVTMLA
jgi:hypothetical protein